MLKAIWPSLARMHNGLSLGANITTSGLFCLKRGDAACQADVRARRNDVLLPLLAHSVSLHARLSSEDPMALHDQGVRRPACVARDAHLVLRQGAVKQRPIRST